MNPSIAMAWAGAFFLWVLALCLSALSVAVAVKAFQSLRNLWKEVKQAILDGVKRGAQDIKLKKP
jgi:hypothetical protein